MQSFDLSRLEPNTFEQLVNMLALRVLGSGHTGFAPGADGGRDGYFEGSAPYPSETERWSGVWYIQSKFHKPHLSHNPQKWLLDRIEEELNAFDLRDNKRTWPDNWIVATNIDPTAVPIHGTFDKARRMVAKYNGDLAKRFHIWGGDKIIGLLANNPNVAEYYSEFVTPGKVLSGIYSAIADANAGIDEIMRYLVVTQFVEQQYTKLEQAGSTAEDRPGIQRLFSDSPFLSRAVDRQGMAASDLAKAMALRHNVELQTPDDKSWYLWKKDPARARVWFVKGGPGQGKSTLTQYISQIQRASLIISDSGPTVTNSQRLIAEEVMGIASRDDLWPIAPRVPMTTELKDFAHWFGQRRDNQSRRLIAYLAEKIGVGVGQKVQVGALRRAFGTGRWLFIFDGLDEVPGDVKDAVAAEVSIFVNDVLVGCHADASVVCTSRPQGYSGQFDALDATTIELLPLTPQQALGCAKPILELGRSPEEARNDIETLQEAIASPTVREIMTTPLQAHIMAVVVKSGGKPPERKWQLFTNFYQVVKKREANRRLPDQAIARILREGDRLLKALHSRLGFELHARAETSAGAITSLDRSDLKKIVEEVVSQLQDQDIESTVNTLMEATTERLVLVSTPDSGEEVRFDIRPLQEFFAAEHIYESGEPGIFIDRIRIIAGDSHWREVMHFLLSALVENGRKSELASAIEVMLEINNGDDERGDRALARRLAIGGVLSARLLVEGVLEQDKRVRNQFREPLSPLLGCTDGREILRGIRPAHSKAWLCDVLLSATREQSESEAIGAAIALAQVLPDGHPATAEVQDYILAASGDFRAAFFRAIAGIGMRYSPASKAEWVSVLAIRALCQPDWTQVAFCASQLVSSHGSSPVSSSLASGFSPEFADAMGGLFADRYQYREEGQVGREVKFGAVDLVYFSSAVKANINSWTPDLGAEFIRAGGYFAAIARAIEVIKFNSEKNINELEISLEGCIENIEFLPDSIVSYFSYEGIGRWRCASDRSHLLKTDHAGDICQLSISPDKNTVDWNGLLEWAPGLAYHVMVGGSAHKEGVQRLVKYLKSEKGRVAFVQNLPALPVNLVVQLSSRLYELGIFVDDLRRDFVSALPNQPAIFEYYRDFKPFPVRLPEEARLLPHILATVVGFEITRIGTTHEAHKSADVLAEWTSRFIPHVSELEALISNNMVQREIRASATLLTLIHPGGARDPEAAIKAIPELYNSNDARWYLAAAGIALRDRIMKGDISSMRAMSALMEHARTQFQARLGLDPIVQSWREASRAPVKSDGRKFLWI